MSPPRSGSAFNPLGDLFEIFPDFDWPESRTRRTATELVQNARAKAEQARAKAEAMIARHRFESARGLGAPDPMRLSVGAFINLYETRAECASAFLQLLSRARPLELD